MVMEKCFLYIKLKERFKMKPGKELDDLIATKVMGWKRMTHYEVSPLNKNAWHKSELSQYWHDQNGKHMRLAQFIDDYCYPNEIWSPSTNIQDAWVVVEKLKIVVYPPGCGYASGEYGNTHETWEAEISDSVGNVVIIGGQETACMAICVVALERLGIEV